MSKKPDTRINAKTINRVTRLSSYHIKLAEMQRKSSLLTIVFLLLSYWLTCNPKWTPADGNLHAAIISLCAAGLFLLLIWDYLLFEKISNLNRKIKPDVEALQQITRISKGQIIRGYSVFTYTPFSRYIKASKVKEATIIQLVCYLRWRGQRVKYRSPHCSL